MLVYQLLLLAGYAAVFVGELDTAEALLAHGAIGPITEEQREFLGVVSRNGIIPISISPDVTASPTPPSSRKPCNVKSKRPSAARVIGAEGRTAGGGAVGRGGAGERGGGDRPAGGAGRVAVLGRFAFYCLAMATRRRSSGAHMSSPSCPLRFTRRPPVTPGWR